RLLYPVPSRALTAGVVIEGYEKSSARCDTSLSVLYRRPQVSSVVQHSPGINDIELSQRFHVFAVEDRTFRNCPLFINAKVLLFKLRGTENRLRIKINRMNSSAKSARRQTKQAAP